MSDVLGGRDLEELVDETWEPSHSRVLRKAEIFSGKHGQKICSENDDARRLAQRLGLVGMEKGDL
jgi:hypothetical protein